MFFFFVAVTSVVSLGEGLETSTQGADIGRQVYTVVVSSYVCIDSDLLKHKNKWSLPMTLFYVIT